MEMLSDSGTQLTGTPKLQGNSLVVRPILSLTNGRVHTTSQDVQMFESLHSTHSYMVEI